MNPSHAHAAPKPKSYVGIGLVLALHLAGIYALSAGLVRPTARPPEIITLKPLPPDIDRKPPPPEPPQATRPTLPDVPVIMVPPPIFDVAPPPEAAPITTMPAPKEATSAATQPGAALASSQAPVAAKPQVQAPGAVCSTMPRPEVPVVSWSGEAVLQVIATVRGGRVVGSEFRVLQGAPDMRTRRTLQRAVEAALAGYQCHGDAMFQQDFAFRVD